MNAQVLHIRDRNKASGLVSGPEDFTVSDGASISAQIVLDSPDVSLYCLDETRQRALFCELPPGVDLSRPPFYYREQFERARRLIAVPCETLHALAQTLPDPERLILIVNIGRCGSTLLSKALNLVEDVTSYSEPDVFTQIVHMRDVEGSRDTELARLLQSCMRLICRPAGAGSPGVQAPHTYAVKFRSPCTEIGDLFYRALPGATFLFVYRNAIDWVGSFYRIVSRGGTPTEMPTEYALAAVKQGLGLSLRLETVYGDHPPATIRAEEALALSWPAFLERYIGFHRAGIPFLALRYEDLATRPRQTLDALFQHCGLPLAQVPQALAAFEEDSQRGTSLAREQADRGNLQPLSEEQIARVKALLARHPTIQAPDTVLPGTIQV